MTTTGAGQPWWIGLGEKVFPFHLGKNRNGALGLSPLHPIQRGEMSVLGRYCCTSRLLAIRLLSRSVGSGLLCTGA